MGVLDFLNQVAKDRNGRTTQRFSSNTVPIDQFAQVPLPSTVDLTALGSISNPITQSLTNFRPLIIRNISDLSSRVATPDLIMLVNPSDMSVSASKINNYRYTRGGWSIEQHGDNLDKIQASGKTGAFITSFTGLTNALRESSAAFQNLYSLFIYYKNNGKVLLEGFTPTLNAISETSSFGGSQALNRIKAVGEVQIEFGPVIYTGSFDSLTITDDANLPFQQVYSFEFTVRKTEFSTTGQRVY